MLLPIRHHDAKLGSPILDRMLPPVHRTAAEDSRPGHVSSHIGGHVSSLSEVGLHDNGEFQGTGWD